MAANLSVIGANQVVGQAAYEFLDLVTVILGHAWLLDATLPEDDDRHHDVAAIATAARRASRITSQLLAISRDA